MPSDASFEIALDLQSRCLSCQAEREPEGRKILQHDSTYIVEAPTPCDCGERRIKVSFGFEVGG